jgi:hypothetical protein
LQCLSKRRTIGRPPAIVDIRHIGRIGEDRIRFFLTSVWFDIRERNIVGVCHERHRFFVIVITCTARVVFKPLLKECLNAPFSDVNGMAHDGAMQAQ